METVAAVSAGVFSIILGSLAKVLLDWQEIGPGAPKDRRGRALFRQMYLAPDFVVLAIGLLLSFKGLQALLAANNVVSRLGDKLPFWFSFLMWMYPCALILSVVLWFIAGERKYIPIGLKRRSIMEVDGRESIKMVDSPIWLKGWFGREGILTLVGGNLMGLGCILSFVVFVVKAF